MGEKKATIITVVAIVLLVVLLLVAALIGNKSDTKTPTNRDAETIVADAQKESKAVKDNEKKEFTYINVDEYLDILTNPSNQFVLVARPTCQYCKIAEPIIQNIMYEYDLDLYYLNTDDFSGDDQNKFVSSNDMFSNGFGTPMLLCLNDNQIVDTVSGLMDRYGYIEFFKAYGLIK